MSYDGRIEKLGNEKLADDAELHILRDQAF